MCVRRSRAVVLQPEVAAIKALLESTHQSRGVLLYVDMHGHSRKKNIFFYGCAEAKQAHMPAEVFVCVTKDVWVFTVDAKPTTTQGEASAHARRCTRTK